jgi:hypothetical protein
VPRPGPAAAARRPSATPAGHAKSTTSHDCSPRRRAPRPVQALAPVRAFCSQRR